MSPVLRKIVYAVSFETFGILVTGLGVKLMTGAEAGNSLVFSALSAGVALVWSYVFNAGFEAWEARQALRGRSLARRSAHALLFEGGLTVLFLPLTMWWFGLGVSEAFRLELGVLVLFLVYTWIFTWAFDRIFGLPASAR